MGNNKKTDEVKYKDIADALVKLGYPKIESLDAAERMAGVPQLATDMIEYVRIGFPKINEGTQPLPQMLLRKLPEDLTVASLITDYLLEPTGAFLMAVELVLHHDEAMIMIEKIITEGLNIRQSDGRHVNMDVPAAKNYPECEVCGTRLVQKHKKCPECGTATLPTS